MATTPSGGLRARRAIRCASFIGLLALAAPAQARTTAARLELTAAEQAVVPWGWLDLGYRITRLQAGIHADLYVAMVTATTDRCVAPDAVFTATTMAAVAPNVAVENGHATITSGALPDQLGAQVMTLYGVLVVPGTSPADGDNWVSNLATLDLVMGALSPSQRDLIAARGNPHAYVIQFFRDSHERFDTWLYEGGGNGQVFQFVNGRPLTSDDPDGRASAKITGTPVAFGPGRFGPGTTPREIRTLLGDPDHVITGPPGTQVWVFDGSQMRITVENGVVRQIAAH